MPFKKAYLLLVLSILLISINVSAQEWKWVVNGLGSNQYSDADRDIAVSNIGTQYVAGYFTQTLTLGAFTLTSPDNYYSDLFLAKIDSAGTVIWAKAFELGSTYNNALGICLGDSDNIYLTAAYDGRIFVSKYDSSGTLKWNSDIVQKNFYGYGTDIALDQYENVYITGRESGNAITAKLNYEGKFQWASKIAGCNSNGAWGYDLAVDRFGNCYIGGGFNCDSVIVGNTIFRKTGPVGYRTLLVKYSSSGGVSWANMVQGETNPMPQVALTDSGYIVLSGSFYSDISFNNQITIPSTFFNYGSYIAKYNSSGNIIWAKNAQKEIGTPKDIVADVDGNIYLGGNWFGNYGGTEMNFYLTKFNGNGDTIYSREVLPGSEYLYGLDIDNVGNMHLTGHANVKGLGVIGPGFSNPYSVYTAKFNTGATTRRRPDKPTIQRMHTICAGSSTPVLFAQGNDIRWYKDSLLNMLVATGNSYQPTSQVTDTLYITQTINNLQSWPKQVIIYFSQLSNFSVEYRNDSLLAPAAGNYTYQWYRDSTAISNNNGGQLRGIKPNGAGNYKVIVSDNSVCNKEATYYYTGDTIAARSICPNETTVFTSSAVSGGYTYQWQVNTGIGYINIAESAVYQGTQSRTLQLIAAPSSWYGYKYRCVVTSGNTIFRSEQFI